MDSNSEQKYLSPTNKLSTFRVLYSKKLRLQPSGPLHKISF